MVASALILILMADVARMFNECVIVHRRNAPIFYCTHNVMGISKNNTMTKYDNRLVYLS